MSMSAIIEGHIVTQLFGSDSHVAGRMGTPSAPGIALVVVNGQVIGSGGSISEAARVALRNLAAAKVSEE